MKRIEIEISAAYDFVTICYELQIRYEFVTAPIRSIRPSLFPQYTAMCASVLLPHHVHTIYRNGIKIRAKLGRMKEIEIITNRNEIIKFVTKS